MTSRPALFVFAIALAAGVPACSKKANAPASTPSQESYAVRHILVRWDREPRARSGTPPPAAMDAPETATPASPSEVEPRKPLDPAAKRYGRTRDQAWERAREIRDRARAPGASFEALAKETSDDPTTGAVGGFVGFVSNWPGQGPQHAIPALVDALARLDVGAVSDPVETEHGVHVLKRISREEGKTVEAEITASVDGILVPWNPIAPTLDPAITKDVAYAESAKAVGELRAGVDLGVVSTHVENALPYREALRPVPGSGYEPLWKAAIALKPGKAWADPVETPRGWALVRRLPYFRAYVRHLVVTHQFSVVPNREQRTVAEARTRAEVALTRVRADRASWDEVVREYSDEPASKDQGGFMGEVSTAEPTGRRAAPEVEEVIQGLAPGEISGVVETSIGFHVFWRVD